MSDIAFTMKELDSIINKYAGQPDIQKDFKRFISILADVIGESFIKAMIQSRKKEK